MPERNRMIGNQTASQLANSRRGNGALVTTIMEIEPNLWAMFTPASSVPFIVTSNFGDLLEAHRNRPKFIIKRPERAEPAPTQKQRRGPSVPSGLSFKI